MASQTHPVCESCHLRPAVHHIRYEQTGHTRHSCQVCFEQFPSPEELALAYARQSSQRNRITQVARAR
jgi:hypothetical protein